MDRPPLRFAVGSDAVELVTTKAATVRDELERWRALSISTDIMAEAPAA